MNSPSWEVIGTAARDRARRRARPRVDQSAPGIATTGLSPATACNPTSSAFGPPVSRRTFCGPAPGPQTASARVAQCSTVGKIPARMGGPAHGLNSIGQSRRSWPFVPEGKVGGRTGVGNGLHPVRAGTVESAPAAPARRLAARFGLKLRQLPFELARAPDQLRQLL